MTSHGAILVSYQACTSTIYLLAFIFILLFPCAVAIAVSPLLFTLLGLPYHSSLLSAIFNSIHHFYCHAILIAAVHFVAVQPDSNYRRFLFKAGHFLLLGCRFCSGPVIAIFILLLKMLSS